jgi:uncharacterized protein YkwD
MARKRSFATTLIAVLIGTVALLAPGSGQARPSSQSIQLMNLHNHERTIRGIRALTYSSSLSIAAYRHSQLMQSRGRIFHSSTSQLLNLLGSMHAIAENVGVGPTISGLHQAFMLSLLHRRNVLNRAYRYIGVGVVLARGSYWVSVLFKG